MRMNKIQPLYDDMRKNKKSRERFSFMYHAVKFDVLFLIDRTPFELLVGVINEQFAFTLQMLQGFFVVGISDEDFRRLCIILNLKAGRETFTSFIFLSNMNEHFPSCISDCRVQPDEIAFYKKKELAVVSEGEKVYFVGWNDHVTDGRSARNFEKTALLMGRLVAEYCKSNNISSMWTARRVDAVKYRAPPGLSV